MKDNVEANERFRRVLSSHKNDPQNFNPITSLNAAQRLAGPENLLVAMEARFVRAGGYAFRIEDTPLRIVFNGKCQVTEQAGTNQNRSLLPVEQPD